MKKLLGRILRMTSPRNRIPYYKARCLFQRALNLIVFSLKFHANGFNISGKTPYILSIRAFAITIIEKTNAPRFTARGILKLVSVDGVVPWKVLPHPLTSLITMSHLGRCFVSRCLQNYAVFMLFRHKTRLLSARFVLPLADKAPRRVSPFKNKQVCFNYSNYSPAPKKTQTTLTFVCVFSRLETPTCI